MMTRSWALVALVVVACPVTAFGQTVTGVSLSDPSVVGTVVDLVGDQALLTNFGNGLPSAGITQQVVRNGSGTLDFYYRITAGVPTFPFALSEVYIGGLPSGVTVTGAFATDGPGTTTPSDFSVVTDGLPPGFTGSSAARFTLPVTITGGPFAPVATPNVDVGGTRWLILRTNATSYTEGQIELIGNGGDFGFTIGPGTAFVPSVGASGVPEPASVGLVGLAVMGLGWRVRRR